MEYTSIYSPLDPSREEIRLVEIISTTPSIVCKLSTVSLHDELVFSALSYVWGDPTITQFITVDGTPVSVTTNLASAIRDVYYHWTEGSLSDGPVQSRRLWADAICINQKDNKEKSTQVPLMKKIYPSAERVLSWIGIANDTIHASFSFCETVLQEISVLSPDERDGIEWMKRYRKEGSTDTGSMLSMNPLSRLLADAYWSRVWIFQEIVLARKVSLTSGTRMLDFDTLGSVIDWLRAIRKRYKIADRPDYIDNNTWLGLMVLTTGTIDRIYYAIVLLEVKKVHVETFGGISGQSYVRSSFLLNHQLCQGYQATNPKDYIYGYMGVTRLCLDPDYSEEKTIASVYCDFVAEWFRCLEAPSDDQPKDMLCDLWFLSNAGVGYYFSEAVSDLPSWAPNFKGISTALKNENAKRIMWIDHAESNTLASCAGKPALIGSSLRCAAVIFGQLSNIGPEVRVDNNARVGWVSWIYAYIQGSPVYRPSGCHALFAVLHILHHKTWKKMGDRKEQQAMPLLWDLMGPLGTSRSVQPEVIFSELQLKHLWRNQDYMQEAAESWLYEEFIEKIWKVAEFQDAIHHHARAWVESKGLRVAGTRDGYIGMFPPRVVEDDIVCILKGSSVPTVLRKVGSHYIHVGTCFVAGLMNGEAEKLIQNGHATTEMVTIL